MEPADVRCERWLRGTAARAHGTLSGRGHPAGEGFRSEGTRRRGLPDGYEVGLHTEGPDSHEVSLLQRRRERAGHLLKPSAHRERSTPACRGRRDCLLRDRLLTGLYIPPRRVHARIRAATECGGPGEGARFPGREHPRHGSERRDRCVPRGRGVHLWRGDRTAREHGGQPAHAPVASAVPRNRRAVRQADRDQQRRDAVQRAAHHQARRGVVPGHRHRTPEYRHEDLFALWQRQTTG